MSTHAHSHENMVPPAALKGAFALVIFSLLVVAAARLGLWEPAPSPLESRIEQGMKPVAERELHFSDQRGLVIVTDASTGQQVAALGSEGSGFVRGVMRGLARERRQHGEGAAAPFRLAQWPDGALTLTDTATGRVIELESFGQDNKTTFARFLASRRTQ